MTESKAISIEQQLESLPPLPTTVANVLAVTNNPESSANDLVKAILPDQTMCIAVLKIANSVLYGRPKKVSSLETAVTVLGFNEVQNIVLAKAAVKAFHPIFQTHEVDLNVFWDHSFTCGLAARIIGEHINLPSGQFFVAGLLHDIGKLAMLLAFGRRYDTGRWLAGMSADQRLQQEKQHFSITHDVVGSRLLQRWQFPDNLITAVQYHHNSGEAEKLQGYPLVIQLADFLAHMYMETEKPDEHTLKTALAASFPDFQKQWQMMHLPWEDITLESWFAWLKVDRENGSGILDILAL
jgi:putative nucleotidyltransferase with HDIG domain